MHRRALIFKIIKNNDVGLFKQFIRIKLNTKIKIINCKYLYIIKYKKIVETKLLYIHKSWLPTIGWVPIENIISPSISHSISASKSKQDDVREIFGALFTQTRSTTILKFLISNPPLPPHTSQLPK